MELYQLRSFATVAELGHLTRAAERLHVSQPALSAQIRSLEETLGVTLFERGSSGHVADRRGAPAPAGRPEVVAKAAALRGLAQSIQGDVRAASAWERWPTPTSFASARCWQRLASTIRCWRSSSTTRSPARPSPRSATASSMRAFYYGPLSHPEIASVPLRTLVYRVAAPAAWRDRVENADDATIAGLPWIMTPPISTHHALATHFFAARGLAPATVLEADNELVIRSLVVSGVGVALLREDLALAAVAAGEVVLWEPAHIETTLQFVWLQARTAEPPLAALDRARRATAGSGATIGRSGRCADSGRMRSYATSAKRIARYVDHAVTGRSPRICRPAVCSACASPTVAQRLVDLSRFLGDSIAARTTAKASPSIMASAAREGSMTLLVRVIVISLFAFGPRDRTSPPPPTSRRDPLPRSSRSRSRPKRCATWSRACPTQEVRKLLIDQLDRNARTPGRARTKPAWA